MDRVISCALNIDTLLRSRLQMAVRSPSISQPSKMNS